MEAAFRLHSIEPPGIVYGWKVAAELIDREHESHFLASVIEHQRVQPFSITDGLQFWLCSPSVRMGRRASLVLIEFNQVVPAEILQAELQPEFVRAVVQQRRWRWWAIRP